MIKPLRDLIVVEPIDPPGKIGAIHIPERYKTQRTLTHYTAKVVAVGPKVDDVCSVGSVVSLHEAWGDPVEDDGRRLIIGRVRDINGVIENSLA